MYYILSQTLVLYFTQIPFMVLEPLVHANPLPMASISSSNSTACPTFSIPNCSQLIFLKLDSQNYLLWLSQFLPILWANDLMGIVDGSESCSPKFLHNDQD